MTAMQSMQVLKLNIFLLRSIAQCYITEDMTIQTLPLLTFSLPLFSFTLLVPWHFFTFWEVCFDTLSSFTSLPGAITTRGINPALTDRDEHGTTLTQLKNTCGAVKVQFSLTYPKVQLYKFVKKLKPFYFYNLLSWTYLSYMVGL